ncbi:type II secretion system F family protein [Ornithinimicrobium cerasi]|uniref:type II secretion system F family protein n=1 Tax=Ornithinimicrobium cerasi TaxID=2248773 RepID=UPI00137B8C5E|nr:type II secretion system F family protein [Ornithinimicrobium cerasi]
MMRSQLLPDVDVLLGACALLVVLAVLLWPRGDGAEPPSPSSPSPSSPPSSTSGEPGGRGRRRSPATRRDVTGQGRFESLVTPTGPPSPVARGSVVGRMLTRPARRDLAEVHLLDALAAALEAGLPTDRALHLALDSVEDEGRAAAWADLRRSADLGLPLAPSWDRAARRTGSPAIAAAGRAWAVAALSGAPLAAAVRSSAHAARERHRLLRAVEVATAGARATVTVLGLLPVAGAGLAAVLGIAPTTLYGSPPAVISAAAGLALLLLGHLVVRALVARVVAGV